MDPATDPTERSRQVSPEANVFRGDSLPPVASKRDTAPSSEPQIKVSRASTWVHRLSLVIFVIFCIELGMLLCVLPWTRVWTENSLLGAHPSWGAILQDNFVRGVISGLGLIDVWIGVWEAVHYRDPGKEKNL